LLLIGTECPLHSLPLLCFALLTIRWLWQVRAILALDSLIDNKLKNSIIANVEDEKKEVKQIGDTVILSKSALSSFSACTTHTCPTLLCVYQVKAL
jgi:hypothetical protein